MAIKAVFTTVALTSLLQSAVHSAPQPYCKPIVGSSGWPSVSEWQALNTSVSGRLLAPDPPGLVCQSNSSVHSNEACASLAQQWTNSSFHASEPFTTDYNDDSCLPDPQAPCSTAPLPAYAVNASNVGDVQEACRFANRTGVRLIVKGTGHDYPGRFVQATDLNGKFPSLTTPQVVWPKFPLDLDAQHPWRQCDNGRPSRSQQWRRRCSYNSCRNALWRDIRSSRGLQLDCRGWCGSQCRYRWLGHLWGSQSD